MARGRGRGGQGNKGRGKKNRGPGKSRKKRVSRKRKQPTRRPRKISSKTRKKISSDRRKKRLSKITNKSLKSKIKSLGLNKKTETKKKTISASQSRRQVRQKTKDKIATRKKISLRSITKALGNLTKGAAAYASGVNTKPKSKLQRQWASFQDRVKQLSTPEAKRERITKRLYNKQGLDYSRMQEGMTIKINPKQWLGGFTAKTGIPTKAIANRIPKRFAGNWINHTLRSPTKLGAKDGWYRGKYNSTGKGQALKNIPIRDIPMRDMMMRPEDWERQKQRQQMGPEPDWLGDLYRSHNIAGGKLDQGARDYWSNEAKTKGRDAAIQSIIGTSKAQGTYGGRKKPKPINTGPKSKAKHTRDNRRMIKSLAGIMAGIRGGV
jgi:hypothetical protein